MIKGHYALILEVDFFKNKSLKDYEIEKGITISEGILNSNGNKSAHTYIFDKKKFTAGEAKRWMRNKRIKYKSFLEDK